MDFEVEMFWASEVSSSKEKTEVKMNKSSETRSHLSQAIYMQ